MADPQVYRLLVVRKEPIAAPADLAPTIDWFVDALVKEDPLLFSLSGYSPSMKVVPVLEGEKSNVTKFLATSDIEWNFGREPTDPTNEVVFFNDFEDDKIVYIRFAFVVDSGTPPKPGGGGGPGGSPECPGLVAEVRLGVGAAGPTGDDADPKERGKRLDTIFSHLVAALVPNFGHVELPGHPKSETWPRERDVGWLTYASHADLPVPPALPPPALVAPIESGTKLYATATLGAETYGDVAKPIKMVRDALQPKRREEPKKAEETANALQQRPSYLLDPTQPARGVAATQTGPAVPAAPPLPFKPSTSAPPPHAPPIEPAPITQPPQTLPPMMQAPIPPPAVTPPLAQAPVAHPPVPQPNRPPPHGAAIISEETTDLPGPIVSEETVDLDAELLARIRRHRHGATPFEHDDDEKDPKKK